METEETERKIPTVSRLKLKFWKGKKRIKMAKKTRESGKNGSETRIKIFKITYKFKEKFQYRKTEWKVAFVEMKDQRANWLL